MRYRITEEGCGCPNTADLITAGLHEQHLAPCPVHQPLEHASQQRRDAADRLEEIVHDVFDDPEPLAPVVELRPAAGHDLNGQTSNVRHLLGAALANPANHFDGPDAA